MTRPLTIWAAVAALATALVGCAETPSMTDSSRLLFDGARPPKEMYHVDVVSDPFEASGAKVLKGGPPGPKNKVAANKCSFLSPAGFAVMPAPGSAKLKLTVGVRKLTDLKVHVLAKDPKADKPFTVSLAGTDRWQTVVLPLDAAVFKPGCTIYDITVFQLGQDSQAELYVREVRLLTD